MPFGDTFYPPRMKHLSNIPTSTLAHICNFRKASTITISRFRKFGASRFPSSGKAQPARSWSGLWSWI